MRTTAALLFLLCTFLVAVVVFQRSENKNIRRELTELRAVTLDYWQHRNDATISRLADQLFREDN